MAFTQYEIDGYWIVHYTEDNKNLTTKIACTKGSDLKGQLYFYKDGASMPANKKVSGMLYLRFNKQKFGDIVETLRLEKPLYLYFNHDDLRGWLSTGKEPVGEEEAT